ncbi:disease resistance protein RPP13-like [Carex rostrata]
MGKIADTIVEIVLGKIADILSKEADFLGEVRDKMESVERELGRIQSFLTDAKSKRTQNQRARHWINEVRDVAYNIEDAVDEYFVEMNYNRQNGGTFMFSMKYFKPPVPALHSLGSKIAKIQTRLSEISESKDRYEVCLDQGKEWEPKQHLRRRYVLEDIDETEVVVGLQAGKNKKKILNLLLDANLSRRAVISIVGPGGVGKTTLTQMIYKRQVQPLFSYLNLHESKSWRTQVQPNLMTFLVYICSARGEFSNHMWLTISQKPNLSDILRKMINLSSSEPNVQDEGHLIEPNMQDHLIEPMEQDECHLIAKLKRLLSGKRYLIVMDDVWNNDLWDQLKTALPNENKGSRVLMTSRFINVAKSADPLMEPYLLDFLKENESQVLLLKKALPIQNPDEICSSILEKVVKPLLNKCKGLPLALIVVGGILSTKDPSYDSYHAWKRVLDRMDWHSDEGKNCMDVLAMSYEDMPHHLKACFIYFSSFPEGHEISAKHLIRLWTAEGFIPCTGSRTMEETAEDCLDELVQRCMVQVSSRYTDGSLKNLKVHDLLRDLAVHEAKEDNFITVFSKGVLHQPNRATRRVSLQFCSSQLIKDINPNTRSFLLFGELLPNFIKFRLLKVLQIEDVGQGIELSGLNGLINLKHLGIRNCKNVRVDSRSFGCLLNLEILDLRGTSVKSQTTSMEMHNLLWKIDTLRHVEFSEPLSGPASLAELEQLQTLRWILVSETWGMELPGLTNLRRFGIKNTSMQWDIVTNVLRNLPSLVSLGIKGDNIPKEIVDMSTCRNLQSLYLEGTWSLRLSLKASLFPPHLIKLTLAGSMLTSDPLPELAKLKHLRKLRLLKLSYLGKKLTCLAGQFLHLKNLELSHLAELEVWEMREESMVKLNYFKICGCQKLLALPEIHHLTAFRELTWEAMPQFQGSGSRAGFAQ